MLLKQLVPYSDVDDNDHVSQGIVSGKLDLRSSLPKSGTPLRMGLVTLVRKCLHPMPAQRPTVKELLFEMDAISHLSDKVLSSLQ